MLGDIHLEDILPASPRDGLQQPAGVCVHPTPRWSLTHHMSPQSDTVPDAHRHPGDIHWMESMYPARALLALQGWRHGPKKGTLEQGSFLGGK